MKSSLTNPAQSSFLAFLVALLLLCGLNTHCDAQTINECSQTLPDSVPRMWVPCKDGKSYEDNYAGYQYIQLSNYLKENNLGKEEAKSVFLPIEGFQKMLVYFESLGNFNFLHVYIASYGRVGGPFPPGLENKLTILFAPAVGKFTPDALGYTLTASGDFDPKSDNCVINMKEDPSWLNRYYNKMNVKLLAKLPGDDDNFDPNGLKSDTRLISYEHDAICQLFKEFYYQEKMDKKNHVTGLEAFFSSYPATGRIGDEKFKNRIFVIFEFTRNVNGKNKVFYIDDQPGFEQRKKPKIPNYLIDSKMGVDNGHLCPPC